MSGVLELGDVRNHRPVARRLAPEIFLTATAHRLDRAELREVDIRPGQQVEAAAGSRGLVSRQRPPGLQGRHLTKFCTSSRAIRPLRPVPLSSLRSSTPSSRANKRTAGLACGTDSGRTASASNATGGVRWTGCFRVDTAGSARSARAASNAAAGGAAAQVRRRRRRGSGGRRHWARRVAAQQRERRRPGAAWVVAERPPRSAPPRCLRTSVAKLDL